MKHLINRLKIPVNDIEKAKKFYSTILGGIEFHDMNMANSNYALFPMDDKFNCGTFVQSEFHKPLSDGVTVYFDGGQDLNDIMKQVGKAGGQIIMSKTFTGKEAGFVGIFLDCEGNRIGLQHL